MASNGNRVVLVVVVVISLLSMIVALIVGLGAWMTPGTSGENTMPTPQAVSVELAPEPVAPEPVAPGAGVEPTFERAHTEERAEAVEVDFIAVGDRFKAMSTAQVVGVLSYNLLAEHAQRDTRPDLMYPFEIQEPGALDPPKIKITKSMYADVSVLTSLAIDFAPIVQARSRAKVPDACESDSVYNPGWDYLNARCRRFVYDELIRIRYNRPLYRAKARLNPKTLALILRDLEAIVAATPMLGDTAAHVYQATAAPAVHDYLLVWDAMGKKRRKSMHARYKKTLKKRHDPLELYREFHEELDQDKSPIKRMHHELYTGDIVGFWMRRIHDGTANDLVKFMKRSAQKFEL